MAGVNRPILLDADAIINLLTWGYYGKVCRKLGDMGCVAEYVARHEVKGHRQDGTGRWVPFPSGKITPSSRPRLVTPHDLDEEQYDQYLQFFAALVQADRGERETFALAWVLGYDVCSRDTNAREIFMKLRPAGCTSEHYDVMDLLRLLKLA